MKLALILLALSPFGMAQTPTQTPTPAPTKTPTSTPNQTAAPATGPAKPATPHSAAGTATKSATPIPRVPGIPKTLYALKYIDTKLGTGELPPAFRYYTVNYTGYLPDGTKFDSTVDPSFKHPTPFTFPYGGHRVITAWDTGFEGMRVGGKRRLYVPYQLGYGLPGHPPTIPAKTNLVFDVELVSISDKPPAPPANAAPRPTPPPTAAPGTATPPPPSSPATPPPAAAPATPPQADAPAKPATPPAK
jgi:peptidylprolyl isomerase